MPHAEVTLPGTTDSVPTARRFVESIITSWGLPDLGWTAALVVSELAANAALHAGTSFTVTVNGDGDGRVRLEVSDGSRRLPLQRAYGVDATTGRGLRLVARIASSWGVDDGTAGKTVWVVLDAASVRAGEEGEDEALADAFASVLDDQPQASGSASARPRTSAVRGRTVCSGFASAGLAA